MTPKQIVLSVCFLLLPLFSARQCSSQSQPDRLKTAPASAYADFPGFRVRLSYSPKALAALEQRKETVVVAAYLSGDPKPGAPKRLIDEMGQIDFDEAKAEVAPGQDVVFAKIRLKKSLLEEIDKNGPQLLINVFSGRKSSPDNLLDCGIFEGALSSAENRDLDISCKLIAEPQSGPGDQ